MCFEGWIEGGVRSEGAGGVLGDGGGGEGRGD